MMDSKISQMLLASTALYSPLSLNSAHSVSKRPIPFFTHQASIRHMKHFLASTPVLNPMGTYVGELQERWQFPSDHLPIGMTYNGINFASWNVLDTAYIDWVIEKNSQGLSRSLIADENVLIEGSSLTIRDRHVVDLILQMLNHPTLPKHFLSLQECGKPFLDDLQSRLPKNFKLIANDGNAVIIDQNQFEIVQSKSIAGIFAYTPERTVQDITLQKKDSKETIRVVNTHIPGDPLKPARFEFANYLAKTFDPQVTTMAMGDMNFNELEMSDAVSKAFPQSIPPFAVYSPYCTNISPYSFVSKAIDHFLVYSANQKPVRLLDPDQVISDLTKTAELLQSPCEVLKTY